MTHIDARTYEGILNVLPILCVDVDLRNEAGEHLLLRRLNSPRKGEWWVIGGRVLKGETLEAAARRKVSEETGLDASDLRAVGYFEQTADVSPFETSSDYHAVSVVFEATVADFANVQLDAQSGEWVAAKTLPADFRIRAFSGAGDYSEQGA